MSHLLAPLPYPWMPGKDYLASDMHAYGEVCVKQPLEAAAHVVEGLKAKPKTVYQEQHNAGLDDLAQRIRELAG